MRKLLMTVAVFVWAIILPQLAAAQELIIFHTNDMHCRIKSSDDFGQSIGLAEMTAAVKKIKSENPATLWFDAGDTFHGMPIITISRGENLISMFNAAGVDVVAPGNHDFNYGSEQLERVAKKSKFAVLNANVFHKDGTPAFKTYKIFSLPDKLKVGVFGLTTPETVYMCKASNTENVDFRSPVECAKEMVKILRPQCDVVVAVMHMGLEPTSEFTSERIAREVEGIDLIVDGHSHTLLKDGMTVGDTLIVQTGWHEYFLGQVNISLDNHSIIDKKAKVLNAEDVKKIAPVPDAKITKIIKNVDARNERFFNQIIFNNGETLTSNREIIRREESKLGDLCADAFRQKSDADIAIVNAGSLRADLPEGAVTERDIIEMFPFGNTLTVTEIDGKTIRKILEHSVSNYPDTFGGFLSVSGLTFSFDSSKPAGERVEEVFVNDEVLDDEKIYTLATTDFLSLGGDGYEQLKDLKVVKEYGNCDEIFTEYLNEFGVPENNFGRITDISKAANKAA